MLSNPAVLRRIEVPFDIRLDRLHLIIQAALGWTNSRLYEIPEAMLDGARSIQNPIGPKTFSMRARRISTK